MSDQAAQKVTVKVTCREGKCSFADNPIDRDHDLDISALTIAELPCGNFVRFTCPECGSLESQQLSDMQMNLFMPVAGHVTWTRAPQEAYWVSDAPVLTHDDVLDFESMLRESGDDALLSVDDPRASLAI